MRQIVEIVENVEHVEKYIEKLYEVLGYIVRIILFYNFIRSLNGLGSGWVYVVRT